jgi:type III secretion system FlhB-like substrate exporter
MKAHDEHQPSAVALRHDAESGAAPRVVASGQGHLAEAIATVAAEHGVPLVRDPDLVQLLALCELGDEVPEELFDAVAHLLVFLFRLNAERRMSAGEAA